MGGDWWIAVMVIGQFGGIALIVWIVANYRASRLRQSSEERLRVLEACGTGKELAEFLETESGQKIMRFFAVSRRNPLKSIVSAAALGMVVLVLGIGFLVLAWVGTVGDADAFLVAGILCLSAGGGILFAAAVSHRLCRGWGLVPKGDDDV
jgi:hypothetical protein